MINTTRQMRNSTNQPIYLQLLTTLPKLILDDTLIRLTFSEGTEMKHRTKMSQNQFSHHIENSKLISTTC